MQIVDSALARRHREGRPVRVAMVGAGFMGRGVALTITQSVPGMTLVAIANRHVDGARRAFHEAGVDEPVTVSSVRELEQAIANGRAVVTDDPYLLCEAEGIDAILEVTGAVAFSAGVAVAAIDHGKHLVLMNAELDSTVGPWLKRRADAAGVVVTNVDGDQPGVILNLYRFVQGIGVTPLVCGNIKGLHDPYRNPTTQADFARQWGQQPAMVTSFADGSKIAFEQAIVANATGLGVARRGMLGPTLPPGTPVEQTTALFDIERLRAQGGIVDYVVGAVPNGGVFVLGTHDDPRQQHFLKLYKVGDGPLYCFYNPYHLCHFEVHNTIARAVLFGDAAVTPRGAPVVDVIATAKTPLKAGQVLDGIGGYCCYGLAENAATVHAERLLPMGLAEGCVLKRDVPQDAVLGYADVTLPEGRLVDRLRAEQDVHFFGSAASGNPPG